LESAIDYNIFVESGEGQPKKVKEKPTSEANLQQKPKDQGNQ